MMGAQPARGLRHSGHAARAAVSVCLIAVVLGACGAGPEPSSAPTTDKPTPVEAQKSAEASPSSPPPSVLPTTAWTSINWVSSDPTPFSGPGNQYIFGGVPWAGGAILVGEEAPLPSGNVEGVVWTSSDNAHWQRIPNSGGTFSGSEIEGVAASRSTLVAVGYSRLEDSATTLTPPVGLAWVSSDGTHWQRVPDEGEVLGDIALHGVAAGAPGFVAYGNDLDGVAAVAFSTDGLHWQREGASDGVFAGSNLAAVTWTGQGFAAVGSHNVAQPNSVVSTTPGQAAAWWSSDGEAWHQGDVGSGAYAIESVQPWIGSLRAVGIHPCFGCVGPPLEWRSSDDGRTWRQLPPPTSANQSGSTALLVGQRAVSLQDQPQQASWSVDGQTWHVLAMTGSPLPDGAQLLLASGETAIAIASVAGATANDQEDMRVFAGELH